MLDLSILDSINPTQLSYDEWVSVGFAIKNEGGSIKDWELWSKRDSSRFKAGECARKWSGFHGVDNPRTGGTLVQLAKQQGWSRVVSRSYNWDEIIYSPREELAIIDPGFVQEQELGPIENWDPVKEITTYLSILFEPNDYVCYVSESWIDEDGKYLPKKGVYTHTAEELLRSLEKCNGDIGAVIGDYDPAGGAWIKFNPLDGKGTGNDNVVSFRFALVESDAISVEKQAAIYAELELPIAVLVYSGNKSMHAVVHIDASTKEEYRERVNFLYEVCNKNGLNVDASNKNPSRLTRMPGIERNGQKQYIVRSNIGKSSWEEWKRFFDDISDSLPEFECLGDIWNNIPPLSNELIQGLLREGHKLLLSGPSKAGKSYMLLQLAIAIAEGKKWLGWRQCEQGRVLYVNLELDRISGFHRLKHLYSTLGYQPKNINNIDIWNLRGRAMPLDMLAPKLIRRSINKHYKAVIIDPIYKVLTGSENEADDMAKFFNQFDKICFELGCATIHCHHHSKGAQGQRSSIDRSSGSGVFNRDPDAILDIIELNINDNVLKQIINTEVCNRIYTILDIASPHWRKTISQDDAVVASKLLIEAQNILGPGSDIQEDINAITRAAGMITGWRLEGTLREFEALPPTNILFKHPVHTLDAENILVDAKANGEEPPWKKSQFDKNKTVDDRKKQQLSAIEMAYQSIALAGKEITIESLSNYMGVSEKSIRRYITLHPTLCYEGKNVVMRAVQQ